MTYRDEALRMGINSRSLERGMKERIIGLLRMEVGVVAWVVDVPRIRRNDLSDVVRISRCSFPGLGDMRSWLAIVTHRERKGKIWSWDRGRSSRGYRLVNRTKRIQSTCCATLRCMRMEGRKTKETDLFHRASCRDRA